MTRVEALEQAFDHFVHHAPCACRDAARDPRIVVHDDACYVGEAINMVARANVGRACNRHSDCQLADELGESLGVYVSHCHEDACEHCAKGRRHG